MKSFAYMTASMALALGVSGLLSGTAHADEAELPADVTLASIGQEAMDRGAVIGDPEAEITIYEFFDYNCGYCRRGFPSIKQVTERYPDVNVVLIDYPVLGEASTETALAVLELASVDSYRLLHDHLMTMKGRASREDVETAAADLGVDGDGGDPHAADALARNVAFGKSISVPGTPTYTLDGVEMVHNIWQLEKAFCGYDGPGSCDGFGVLLQDAIMVAERAPDEADVFARRAAETVIARGSANDMNAVCWDGAKARLAAPVLPACDAAVEAEPTNAGIRDSRGLARALAGDTAGAIEDFEYLIDGRDPDSEMVQSRQLVIDALMAGEDPFTDEFLAEF